MGNLEGEAENGGLKLDFDACLRLEFRGAKVTTDAGLLAVRELDEALGLTGMAGAMIRDGRTGKNIRHEMAGLLRQSVSFDKAVKAGRLRGRERPGAPFS